MFFNRTYLLVISVFTLYCWAGLVRHNSFTLWSNDEKCNIKENIEIFAGSYDHENYSSSHICLSNIGLHLWGCSSHHIFSNLNRYTFRIAELLLLQEIIRNSLQIKSNHYLHNSVNGVCDSSSRISYGLNLKLHCF